MNIYIISDDAYKHLLRAHYGPGASERGLVVKNPPANAGDTGLILGLERSPGEGNGNLLQYSYLGNPMDRGPWWATSSWGVIKSWTQFRDYATTLSQMFDCLKCLTYINSFINMFSTLSGRSYYYYCCCYYHYRR